MCTPEHSAIPEKYKTFFWKMIKTYFDSKLNAFIHIVRKLLPSYGVHCTLYDDEIKCFETCVKILIAMYMYKI